MCTCLVCTFIQRIIGLQDRSDLHHSPNRGIPKPSMVDYLSKFPDVTRTEMMLPFI